MKLATVETDVLVELLGTSDFIWQPIRRRPGKRAGVLLELRRRYRAEGVAWASEALGAAERKAAQRAIEALGDAGLVDVERAVGRTVAVRLTEHGDLAARVVTNHFTAPGDALKRTRELHKVQNGPGCAADDGSVPETLLTGGKGWGDGRHDLLHEIQLDLTPALTRGWVESSTSIQGHAWYRLTEAGVAVVEHPPTDDFDFPAPLADGHDRYIAAVGDAKARVDAMMPTNPGEIGEMPAPVCRELIEGAGDD